MPSFDVNQRIRASWHSRGYLPHLDVPGLVQMITVRLADSLPTAEVAELARLHSSEMVRRQRLEDWLDAGFGACHLRDPRIAHVVESALLHFDGHRFRLLAWVIMANHVHVVMETLPDHPLSGVIHSWKSFSANEANRVLKRRGWFWQPEYFDRAIRDDKHLEAAIRYTEDNPVKARLVESPEDWPFSSAPLRTR